MMQKAMIKVSIPPITRPAIAHPFFLLTFSAMILIITAKGEAIKNMVPPRLPIEEPQPGRNNSK